MNRKNFLQTSLASAFALTGLESFSFSFKRSYNNKLPKLTLEQVGLESAPFSLAALPYTPESLEPHIDKMTMEIHHGRHHKAYVDNLNKAVTGTPMEKLSLWDLLKEAGKQPAAVRNNAGGHWNHTFFWNEEFPKVHWQTKSSKRLVHSINLKKNLPKQEQPVLVRAGLG
jgi:superoxide dismutase, Fe-Mn family